MTSLGRATPQHAADNRKVDSSSAGPRFDSARQLSSLSSPPPCSLPPLYISLPGSRSERGRAREGVGCLYEVPFPICGVGSVCADHSSVSGKRLLEFFAQCAGGDVQNGPRNGPYSAPMTAMCSPLASSDVRIAVSAGTSLARFASRCGSPPRAVSRSFPST